MKDEAEGAHKEIEEITVELSKERSHVSALEERIAKLQRDLADPKARAATKTRVLAVSAEKLETLVRDYRKVINFDCAAENQRLGEDEALLEAEWEKVKGDIDEFISSHGLV